MQHQGRIITWRDDKGFGFIKPNGTDEKVFVHVSAFVNRQRRPQENDLVTYRLVTDDKGRAQAHDVAFAGEKTNGVKRPASFPPAFATAFMLFVAASVLQGWIPLEVLYLYLGASALAFITYAWDKSAARRNAWRTQETTLHLLGLVGGWPGALLAQRWLRHKSAKTSFQTMYWITVLINCAAFAWLFSEEGKRLLASVIQSLASFY